MGNIEFPITTIDGCKFQLDIDLDLYASEAIDATAYKFTGMCYVFKHKINEKIVRVVFEAKDGKNIDDSMIKQFCNELMDQQVRYNVDKQFGKIRDMIVEEAFKPIS